MSNILFIYIYTCMQAHRCTRYPEQEDIKNTGRSWKYSKGKDEGRKKPLEIFHPFIHLYKIEITLEEENKEEIFNVFLASFDKYRYTV
jgi:phosphoenolpyruvate synthase/pyruvate phosphate dikinase